MKEKNCEHQKVIEKDNNTYCFDCGVLLESNYDRDIMAGEQFIEYPSKDFDDEFDDEEEGGHVEELERDRYRDFRRENLEDF